MEEVRSILEWTQMNMTDLKAVYVPTTQNHLADNLSRNFLSNNEWSLSCQAFSLITKNRGIPDIDLATATENTKCQRYLSRAAYPSAEEIDCLKHLWNFQLGYIFPPTPVIARFLFLLKRSTSTVIAVIPFWPRRPWITMPMQMNTENPLPLPVTPDLLFQD